MRLPHGATPPRPYTPLSALLGAGALFTADNYGACDWPPQVGAARMYGRAANYLGVACGAGRLYLACYQENKLRVVVATTAELQGEIPVPHPTGVCWTQGRLVVTSGTSLVSVDPAGGAVTPLVTTGLEAPMAVAADRQGHLYVSDWGRAMCVKVYDAQGKFLRTIGPPGGRAWVGPYDPRGMLLPRGLAVDSSDQLWVAEFDCSPRRFSVWKLDGTYRRDYRGPAVYGSGGCMVNPDRPEQAFGMGNEFRLDWQAKTATVVGTAERAMKPEEFFTPDPGSCGRLVKGGRRELWIFDRYTGPTYTTICEYKQGRMVPLASFGNVQYLLAGSHDNYPAVFRGHANSDLYCWADENGDGQVQAGEVHFAPGPRRDGQPQTLSSYGGPYYAKDWSYWSVDYEGALWKWPLAGWTACGAPRWDPAAAQLVTTEVPSSGGGTSLTGDQAGNLYLHLPVPVSVFPDGTVRWKLAYHNSLEQEALTGGGSVQNGNFGETVDAPNVGECLTLNGFREHFVTTDGLLVGSVLQDARVGPPPGPDVNIGESFCKYLWRDSATGKIYLQAGKTAYHLFEITGWDKMRRVSGAVPVTEKDAQAAQALVRQEQREAAQAKEYTVAAADQLPTIDGDLADWDMTQAINLPVNAQMSAKVALRADREALYLAYDVQGRTLQNGAKNWRELFARGDAVDLMLRSGPATGDAPGPGDFRLLFSEYDGQPVAVLYQPVAADQTDAYLFRSPGQAAPFDRVVLLPPATVAVRRTAAGYTLEAAVPWSALGMTPPFGQALRGDVGVLFSDGTGRYTSLRAYWANRDTAITDDLPSEARLLPGNWGLLHFDTPGAQPDAE